MQRKELILSTALKLFKEQGYEQTSLKQIISRTGGSLATLYKLFASKDELFYEAIKHEYSKQFQKLFNHLEQNSNLALNELLVSFAKEFLAFLSSKDNVATLRLIVARIYADKKLADLIAKQTQQSLENRLADIFAKRLNKPQVEARMLADYYLALLKSAEFSDLIFYGLKEPHKYIETHANKTCAFFLNALNIKEV